VKGPFATILIPQSIQHRSAPLLRSTMGSRFNLPAPRMASLFLFALATVLLVAAHSRRACASEASVTTLQDFPHPAVYLTLSSDGHQIDSDSMCAKIARYSVAVIPASPTTEKYAARLHQIRMLNPSIVLLAYFPADFMWNGDAYPAGNIYGDCWKMFKTNDWWLYNTAGAPFS